MLASKVGQWDLLLTFHSYGNYWFTPWGYTSDLPSDYNDLVATMAEKDKHLDGEMVEAVRQTAKMPLFAEGGAVLVAYAANQEFTQVLAPLRGAILKLVTDNKAAVAKIRPAVDALETLATLASAGGREEAEKMAREAAARATHEAMLKGRLEGLRDACLPAKLKLEDLFPGAGEATPLDYLMTLSEASAAAACKGAGELIQGALAKRKGTGEGRAGAFKGDHSSRKAGAGPAATRLSMGIKSATIGSLEDALRTALGASVDTALEQYATPYNPQMEVVDYNRALMRSIENVDLITPLGEDVYEPGTAFATVIADTRWLTMDVARTAALQRELMEAL
jgi:hypothetical protein